MKNKYTLLDLYLNLTTPDQIRKALLDSNKISIGNCITCNKKHYNIKLINNDTKSLSFICPELKSKTYFNIETDNMVIEVLPDESDYSYHIIFIENENDSI